MEGTLSVVRIAAALALLAAASAMDWRTRRVKDAVWMAMGGLGSCLMAVQMLADSSALGTGDGTYGPAHFLVLFPVCLILADLFWDRDPIYEGGKWSLLPLVLYVLAGLALAAMVWAEGLTVETGALLAVPAVMAVFLGFFFTGIVRGGADAKALISLAVLFPVYPAIEGLPLIPYPADAADLLQMTFPFAFLILMNAAVIHVIVGPLVRLFRNLARRDHGFPEMLLGYRMDVADVPKSFVWPMEVVRDGEVVTVLFPRRDGKVSEELAKLKEAGVERIWVTPKDPFMIPMTLGLVFSFVVGNLVLLLFSI